MDTDGDGDIETRMQYVYDHLGTRVGQFRTDDSDADGDLADETASGTSYVIDSNNHSGYSQALEEWTGGSTPSLSYVIGHDILSQRDATNGLVHLLKDGHGSTRLAYAYGTVDSQSFLYDAYGNILVGPSTAMTSILYSDQQTDSSTGLQYLRARYYDPTTGRFNRLDPYSGNSSDPQSLHKYLYANASPVMYSDPTGLFTMAEINVNMALQITLAGVMLTVATGYPVVRSGSAALGRVIDELGYLYTDLSAAGLQLMSIVCANAAVVVRAIEQAYSKVGSKVRSMKPKIFPIIQSTMPNIYAFDVSALMANPSWFYLTYNGAGSPRTGANRSIVRMTYGSLMTTAPLGYQLDEFPYASTREGGVGALGMPVPGRENAVQGGLLGAFYRYTLKGVPSKFLVVPVPL